MLLIPTYLARSLIDGIGAFTPLPIAKGTLLWEFNPAVDFKFTQVQFEQLPEPYRSRARVHAYIDDEGFYVLCGDNTKFLNHSNEPNCDDSGAQFIFAQRDIAAHEELTCDYKHMDHETWRRAVEGNS
ncbi:MAG: SET domain-containing protein-lysine N-methyltransferase [Pseudomonadota bacterium]